MHRIHQGLFQRPARAALTVALLVAPLALHAQDEQRSFTLEWECSAGISIDLQSNRSVCRGLSISDGEVVISADEGAANETNFDRSEWQLDGNVRIAFDSAVLSADQATFRFLDNALVAGELSGTPVVLEDFILEENVEVRATADRISYDSENGTARLEGEATLRRGAREFLGCDLIYDLNAKSMQSGSSACGVRMTIPPRAEAPAEASTDAPADAPADATPNGS